MDVVAGDLSARSITRLGPDYHICFHAMATPCELRIETDSAELAERVGAAAEREARRIEWKFSRYRDDSVVGKINSGANRGMVVDAETANLLDCAGQCFEVSGGLFDITSGVLRRVWHFDGSDKIPNPERVRELLPFIGWSKVSWRPPELTLPPGMEIDLGGIAKEYAVDRVLEEAALAGLPVLVNFGGDLRVTGPRAGGIAWNVAIESVDISGGMAGMLQLTQGALATSGDARRFLLKDGIRYGHILDPRSGWPVRDTPRSVTVAAATCIEAGLTATLAMLQGADAETFLKEEGFQAWCIR
jgi:thiamine biosynthesis lipoprotein